MKLSIVIVSYKVKDKLRLNLQTLFANVCDFDFEVFVVDNHSQDGTVEMINNEFPQVKLIDNQQNLGFAAANNQALKTVAGEYVLLLNPDMKVNQDTLKNMIAWLEQSAAGIAGCKLITEQGSVIKQVRRFPHLLDQLAIVLKLPHLFPKVLDKYILADFDYERAQQVDSIRGGFMMIKKSVLKQLGLLDQRYFLWFEEVDYCKRAQKAGIEVWYTPAATCTDYIGQSFKQLPTGLTQKYFRNSMLAYFRKWHSFDAYLILAIAWPVGRFMAWLGEKLGWQKKAQS
jgi:hypothetical protein